MPAPTSLVPVRVISKDDERPTLEAGLQLLRRQVLVPVHRVHVEHVKKGLLGEVRHFLLNRLRVPDSVALWKVKLG